MGRAVEAAWAMGLVVVACGSGGGSATGGANDASVADGRGDDASVDVAADDFEAAAAVDSGGGVPDSGSAEAGDGPGDGGGDGGDGSIPPLTCTGDIDEPNNTQVTATPLASIDDCDSSGSTVTAVSSGTGDPDWMHYFGTDTVSCVVDPTAQIDVAGLRLCIFIICPTGITTISSCTNGSPDTSPAQTPGCCTTSTMAMTVQMSCGGTRDSADVYMRVDQPASNQCIPYDVAYHF